MSYRKLVTLGLSIVLCIGLSGAAMAASSGKISKENVNMRKSASKDSDVITVLDKGDTVTIESNKGDWYKIKVGSKTGYVRKDMISAEQANDKESPSKIYIVKDSVNIRSKASTSADVLTRADNGAHLTVLEVNGDWYKVECDGKTGYVRADMCSESAPEANKEETSLADDAASETQETGEALSDATNEEIAEDAMVAATQSAESASTKEVQQILKDLNFYYKEVDGNMGTVSLAALKSFQRAYGLEIDGKTGSETVAALREARASGGNGSSAERVQVSENGVILAEWFNAMKYKVPKYEHLRVVDVDTGVEFKLRAFSLGNHADVEPPTKEDTQILYRINGNKWTWTPRAIWVYIDGQVYAAAINVQPHGPDTLPNNGMSGQICMHFLHSRQHNTGQENKNLQEAVQKAYANAAKAPSPSEPAKTVDDPSVTETPLTELSVEEMMALIDEEE